MAESARTHKMVVIILDQPEIVDELLTGFLDIGVPGATVLESRGMGQIIRQDMPIFAGLASLFPDHTGSRVIFAAMPEDLVDEVFNLIEEIVGHGHEDNTAICLTLPVDQFRSIRSTNK